MLKIQEFSGSSVLQYLKKELSKGDYLTDALWQRLASVVRVYTFAPEGGTLRSSTVDDFRYSTTLSIPDESWQAECDEQFTTEIERFLVGACSRIMLVEIAESDEDLRLYQPKINPKHLFIDRTFGNNCRTTYLYVVSKGVSSSAIQDALWEERHYPRRTVLAELGEHARLPTSGEHLDKIYAEQIADSTHYLLVGAYDDETRLICEFPARD